MDAAAERGVGAYGLGPYRLEHPGRPGLLFGYGNLDERSIEEGIRLLSSAVRA